MLIVLTKKKKKTGTLQNFYQISQLSSSQMIFARQRLPLPHRKDMIALSCTVSHLPFVPPALPLGLDSCHEEKCYQKMQLH